MVKTEKLTVTENVKIPGTNLVIKKGKTFEFSTKNEYKDERANMKHIEIKEECKIPGTGIVLEKGDKIKVVSENVSNSLKPEMIKVAQVICSKHPDWKIKFEPSSDDDDDSAVVRLLGSSVYVRNNDYWDEGFNYIPGFNDAYKNLRRAASAKGFTAWIDAPYKEIWIGVEE